MKSIRLKLCGLMAALLTLTAEAGWGQSNNNPLPAGPLIYQGTLSESNAPANGLYDFMVRLFDTGTNGNPVGSEICVVVPVANGLFTLPLPASSLFNGEPRWLELSVRRNGMPDPFLVLEPLQQIGVAPYAAFAINAATAQSVAWSNITDRAIPIPILPGIGLVSYAEVPGGGFSTLALDTNGASAGQVLSFSGSNTEWKDPVVLIGRGGLPVSTLNTSNATAGQVLLYDGTNEVGWKDPVVRPGTVTTASIADGAVTASKVPQGTLLKSLNGLRDDVLLSVKGGLTLNTLGNLLEIEAPLSGDCTTYADCYWSLLGNAGTTAGVNFVGTTDIQPLELKVNNRRALRLEPAPNVVNVIAGHVNNAVMATYYGGAIGGGSDNLITNNLAVVGGGNHNVAGGQNSVVAGGNANTVSSDFSNIGGGLANRNFGYIGAIGGGSANYITNAGYATVAGGYSNWATNSYATVGGGEINIAGGAISTVAGGDQNWALGYASSIAGGEENRAYGEFSTVGGGYLNGAYAYGAVAVGGGGSTPVGYAGNKAIGPWSAVVGGYANVVSNLNSFIGGGALNNAFGNYSSIPGGRENATAGNESLAAGKQAKAVHDNTFVWNDGSVGDFGSTGNEQFLVHAKGGVGVNLNNPDAGGVSIQSPGTALELREGDLRVTGAGVNTGTIVFTHAASAGSINGHITTINNPRTDGRPDAILLVTHNWSKDTAVDPYETHPVGVYYDGAKWNIFHEDFAAMPEGRAFNVMVINP